MANRITPISFAPGWVLVPHKGELIPVRKGRGYKGYIATEKGWVEVKDIYRIEPSALEGFSWDALYRLVEELEEGTKEKLGLLGFLSVAIREAAPVKEELTGSPVAVPSRVASLAISALILGFIGFAVGNFLLKNAIAGALLALAGVALAYFLNPKAEVREGQLYLNGRAVGKVWLVFSLSRGKGQRLAEVNVGRAFYAVDGKYTRIPDYAALLYLKEGGTVELIYPKRASRAVERYLRKLGLL